MGICAELDTETREKWPFLSRTPRRVTTTGQGQEADFMRHVNGVSSFSPGPSDVFLL
jgi:hypothetical protein